MASSSPCRVTASSKPARKRGHRGSTPPCAHMPGPRSARDPLELPQTRRDTDPGRAARPAAHHPGARPARSLTRVSRRFTPAGPWRSWSQTAQCRATDDRNAELRWARCPDGRCRARRKPGVGLERERHWRRGAGQAARRRHAVALQLGAMASGCARRSRGAPRVSGGPVAIDLTRSS